MEYPWAPFEERETKMRWAGCGPRGSECKFLCATSQGQEDWSPFIWGPQPPEGPRSARSSSSGALSGRWAREGGGGARAGSGGGWWITAFEKILLKVTCTLYFFNSLNVTFFFVTPSLCVLSVASPTHRTWPFFKVPKTGGGGREIKGKGMRWRWRIILRTLGWWSDGEWGTSNN